MEEEEGVEVGDGEEEESIRNYTHSNSGRDSMVVAVVEEGVGEEEVEDNSMTGRSVECSMEVDSRSV